MRGTFLQQVRDTPVSCVQVCVHFSKLLKLRFYFKKIFLTQYILFIYLFIYYSFSLSVSLLSFLWRGGALCT